MNVQIVTYRAFRPTARILAQLLVERGYTIDASQPPGATVCYGRSSTLPDRVLNAKTARFNKLNELLQLRTAEIPTPRISVGERLDECPNWLGRKLYHRGGRDIIGPYNSALAAMFLRARRADFLTGLLDVAREWRVWVYRRRHLATYEKVLMRPEQHKRFGRNYGNGYSFKLREVGEFPREVGILAARAVDVMDLDFGGVDVVETKDGKIYVLEVNAAPGILGDKRRAVRKLSFWVHDWLQKGCPKRRAWRDGDEEGVYANQG